MTIHLDFKKQCSFIALVLLMVLFTIDSGLTSTLALRPTYSLGPFLIEAWRIFTGHLVHAGWAHLGVNLINLILLRLVFREWLSSITLLLFFLFSATVISLGLWLTSTLSSYVGFSGIFHGLLAYLLLLHWRQSPLIFTVATLCLAGKVLYEQLYGASAALVEMIDIRIAIDAHAWGLLSGILFWCAERLFRTAKNEVKFTTKV